MADHGSGGTGRKRRPAGIPVVGLGDVPRPAFTGAEAPPCEGGYATVRVLEGELRATRRDLQATIEELQTANEELQSTNEELTTVNSQLQEKIERLDAANSDLANLLASTGIATLILDHDLRVRYFTPAITQILNLIPSDAGRPIGDLSSRFTSYDLTADARGVVRGGPEIEREERLVDGSSFLVRVLPYLDKDERVAGVVATFNDVTRLRRAEESTARLGTVAASSNDAVILFDLEGRILLWNRAAERAYGWTEAEATRMNVRDLAPAADVAGLDALFRRLAAGETVTTFEIQRRTKDGRLLDVWQTIAAVRDGGGRITAFAATERDVTARNRVHQELSAAKEEGDRQRQRLEAVMAALPVGLAITDERGGSLQANDAYEKIWGGPRPQTAAVDDNAAYRARWADTGAPVRPREWASARAVETGQAVVGQLLEIEGFDGVRRTVINSGAPTRDAGGRTTGSVAAIMDISELRKAQQLLLQSQRQLALAASATRIGMFDWELGSGHVLWTPAHEVIFGYLPPADPRTTTMETITATRRYDYRAWADRIHPADLPRVEELIRVSRGDCSPLELQYRIVWPDGSVRWVESRCAFLCDTAGNALRLFGIVMDISDRKTVEEELRRNREDFKRAQGVAHVGSWRLDVRRNELVWSDECHRIFGAPAGTTQTYESFLATVHPEDRDRVDEKWQAALRGAPYDIEHRVIADGRVKWVRELAELEIDRAGVLLGAFGTTQDVTDRKTAEESLQRTAALLARSNTDLEHFAYVASHDLQEPLRMVTGFLGLLRERYESELDGKARRWITHAADGARRMSALIDDLLAFSRVDRIERKILPTSALRALNKALVHLRAAIEESGAKITHDALPTVPADGAQLAQLLQNLIGNALKFQREGRTCEIHVGARRDGAQWVLSVRDNGIGIPPKQSERIFLIFQRLHARGKYPGTGIGLAICKRIVEQHGGRIWVESRPGEGSTFFFTLQAASAPPRRSLL